MIPLTRGARASRTPRAARRGSLPLRPRAALLAALALLLPSLGACGRSEAAGRPPDVVLIVVDTLRADRVGAYGYPRPTTPVLDGLAADGALFEDAVAQSSWTLPSMVSMLSSRYVTSYRDRMLEDSPALAELLKDEGYTTVGVCANGLLQPDHGFARGFDRYVVERTLRSADVADTPYREADEVLELVEQELDRVDEDAPLFLYVHLMDPHAPYVGRARYDLELPLAGTLKLPREGWHKDQYEAALGGPVERWGGWLATMNRARAHYDQEVRHADQAIGRLLDELRERGRLERAVVAVTSDPGAGLYTRRATLPPEQELPPPTVFFHPEHGLMLNQELVAAPLVLWGRGVPEGVRVPAAVENVDVLPTLLELVGAEPPPELAGESLVPAMEDPLGAQQEPVFSWVMHQMAVREPDTGWKLLVPTPAGRLRGGEPQLVHLPSDPEERANRLEEAPEVAARLFARLERFLAEHVTPSSLNQPASAEHLERLRGLGYTDDAYLPDATEEGEDGR